MFGGEGCRCLGGEGCRCLGGEGGVWEVRV